MSHNDTAEHNVLKSIVKLDLEIEAEFKRRVKCKVAITLKYVEGEEFKSVVLILWIITPLGAT